MSVKLTQTVRGTSSSSPTTGWSPSLTTVDVREIRELTETEKNRELTMDKDRELTMGLSLAAGPEPTKSV